MAKLLEMQPVRETDLVLDTIRDWNDLIANLQSLLRKGRVWLSFDDTDPQTLFGGTWNKIKGCFLWCAGSVSTGETWGDADHKVYGSVAHRHLTSIGFDGLRFFGLYGDSQHLPIYDSVVTDRSRYGINAAKTSDVENEQLRINYTAHERNMPPFMVVHAWERVG